MSQPNTSAEADPRPSHGNANQPWPLSGRRWWRCVAGSDSSTGASPAPVPSRAPHPEPSARGSTGFG